MMRETIKSKIKISTFLILILGGIGGTFVAYYLTTNSLRAEYPQITGLIVGGCFGLLGFASIISLLTLDILELDREKLVVMSILRYPKRIIYLSEILSYNEIKKENKSGSWFDLTVFTKTGHYKISSSVFSNYKQFKSILTEGKQRNIQSEKLWHFKTRRNFGIGFIVIGSLFLFGFWNMYKNKDKATLSNELTMIKITVQDNLRIGKRKGSRWVDVKAIEYPGFNFNLSGTNFRASNAQLLIEDAKQGDLIELDILKDSYEKKLIKTAPLTFWDKYYSYSSIDIYGLRKNNKAYLTLDAYNEERKRDSSSWDFWFFLLFALGITGTGVYLLAKTA